MAKKGRSNSSQRRPPRLAVDALAPGELLLDGERAHYVRNVLRLQSDQQLILFDGQNHRAHATITGTERGRVRLEVGAVEQLASLGCALTVGLPPPRGERADWAVEKLTEVGVARIVWITTARALERHGDRSRRWQRVATAAAAQSGRASLPELTGPIPFAELLEHEAEARWIGDGNGAPLTEVARGATPASVLLAVGPEGGFTDEEVAGAEQHGYQRVCLGPLILRVETAAVVGAGIILAGTRP
jgi:16S rRNA (uracil1498-N3)-methyltransferase